jgi:hypothetical protein
VEESAPRAYDGHLRHSRTWQKAEEIGRLPEGTPVRIWTSLSQSEKRELFEQAHGFPSAHTGVDATRDTIVRNIPLSHKRGELEAMRKDIKAFVAGCTICQLNQHYDHSDHVSSALPARPFCDLSVDFLDVSPKDRAGYNAVLVVVDNFSGFVELFPTKDKEAITAARCLLQVVGRVGAPVTLRSDQAGSFDSSLADALNSKLGTFQHRIIPGRHQANGIVERVNQQAIRMLRACVLDPRAPSEPLLGWADILPLVQLAINRTPSSRTGVAPAKLIFGSRINLDRGLFAGAPSLPDKANVPDVPYVQALDREMQRITDAAEAHHAERLARIVARRQLVSSTERSFMPGEYVLVQTPEPSGSVGVDKLAPRWQGPFRVLSRDGESAYTVFDTTRAKQYQVRSTHPSQMTKFNWSYLRDLDDSEDARRDYAAALALKSKAVKSRAPLEIVGVRRKGSNEQAPLEVGRGSTRLSSFEFLVLFEDPDAPREWLPLKDVDGTGALAAFQERFVGWR